jgi:hypothetical protein
LLLASEVDERENSSVFIDVKLIWIVRISGAVNNDIVIVVASYPVPEP